MSCTLQPAARLLPYAILEPAFRDGAVARRYMALPAGGRIGFHPDTPWTFPTGTVLVQHWERNGQRLETRVLVAEAAGWPCAFC